nr:toll-like receptor 2 [Acipenser dabryanus]
MGKTTLTLIVKLFTVHLFASGVTKYMNPSFLCQKCDAQKFCNCSAAKLLTVPSLPLKDMLGFNLSLNDIEVIKKTDFKTCIKLKVLSLQHNRIHSIDNEAFTFLTALVHLDLSYNHLVNLSGGWFGQLCALQHLNLLGNDYLTLGHGQLFQNLTRLRSLKFGNPSFRSIKKDDFVGTKILNELVLYGNRLKNYEAGSFKTIEQINHVLLSLHDLFKQDTNQAKNILNDLSNSSIYLELRDLILDVSEETEVFSAVSQKTIKKLTFKNITLNDRSMAKFLKVIDRAGILHVEIEDCQLLGTGRWYNASDVQLDTLHTLTIKNITINSFYLFSSLSYLKRLLVPLKRLTVINSKVFLIPCPTSRHFKNLEYLDLSGNLLTDNAMTETACNGDGSWQSLQVMNISKNSIKLLGPLSQLFTKLNKLVSLDLSQNVFKDIPELCQWPPSLKNLNLSTSRIKNLTPCIPETIEILDVSNNELNFFTINLPFLKEIYVSNNKLMSLPEAQLAPSLQVLFIGGNKLNTLSKDKLKAFKKLDNLEAGNNRYMCSCEFLSFMHQEAENMVRLDEWPENYVCDSPSAFRGSLVRDASPSVFECQRTIAISLLCTSIFFITVSTVILCKKLHIIWYIQMTWAWLKAKRRPTNTRHEDICYDAFISYSELDSEWVETYLVQELESSQPPFKLCLHKRDFLPGKWIIDNIINSIEKSHKTLFVLSEHFVRSEWCKYELDFSHFRLFHENNDTAILILLEPIRKEDVPNRFCKLRKIMNTQTYLEWPQDEGQRAVFWFNLKVALKRQEFTVG